MSRPPERFSRIKQIPVTLYRDMVAEPDDVLKAYIEDLLRELPEANVVEIRVSVVNYG